MMAQRIWDFVNKHSDEMAFLCNTGRNSMPYCSWNRILYDTKCQLW